MRNLSSHGDQNKCPPAFGLQIISITALHKAKLEKRKSKKGCTYRRISGRVSKGLFRWFGGQIAVKTPKTVLLAFNETGFAMGRFVFHEEST
jgi:hypothetical protein